MDTKEFLSIVLKPVWTWIIGGVFAVIGVIVFFIPDLGNVLNWPSLSGTFPWYLWVSIALFIWSLGVAWEAASRIYKEPPELEELMKIRTQGVELRNSANQFMKEEKEIHAFVEKYHLWDEHMIERVGKLSKSAAEELRILDQFEVHALDSDRAYEQTKFRSMLSAKLERLKIFVNDFRRMKNS